MSPLLAISLAATVVSLAIALPSVLRVVRSGSHARSRGVNTIVRQFQVRVPDSAAGRVVTVGAGAMLMSDAALASALSQELEVSIDRAAAVVSRLRGLSLASDARPVDRDHAGTGAEPVLGSRVFEFQRRLALAAASDERRTARASTRSSDGSVEVDLIDVSRREIQLIVTGARRTTAALALLRVETDNTIRTYVVPVLAERVQVLDTAPGSILLPTTASSLRLDLDIRLISPQQLTEIDARQIERSVRAAVGANLRWWSTLLADATAGRVELDTATVRTLRQALAARGVQT